MPSISETCRSGRVITPQADVHEMGIAAAAHVSVGLGHRANVVGLRLGGEFIATGLSSGSEPIQPADAGLSSGLSARPVSRSDRVTAQLGGTEVPPKLRSQGAVHIIVNRRGILALTHFPCRFDRVAPVVRGDRGVGRWRPDFSCADRLRGWAWFRPALLLNIRTSAPTALSSAVVLLRSRPAVPIVELCRGPATAAMSERWRIYRSAVGQWRSC